MTTQGETLEGERGALKRATPNSFDGPLQDAINLCASERNRWEKHSTKDWQHWRDVVVKLQTIMLLIPLWQSERERIGALEAEHQRLHKEGGETS
jgi:hypothetical protein